MWDLEKCNQGDDAMIFPLIKGISKKAKKAFDSLKKGVKITVEINPTATKVADSSQTKSQKAVDVQSIKMQSSETLFFEDEPIKVLTASDESGNVNVLFLCMSTLPWNFRNDTYIYKEGNLDYTFHCHSQLEAGTKALMKKLYDMGEKLDRIVILHTKECAQPSNSKDIEKYQKAIHSTSLVSANEFYKQRIIDAVDKNLDENFFEFVPLYDESGVENVFASVPKVCEKIIGNSKANHITVYVDTQGGRRNETFVMNCVLNMLKLRDIHIGEYFATDFNPADHEHFIRNVTLNNIMLDLVASMKVFIETGRADELSKYYRRYKEVKNVSSIPENRIIEQIKRLSDVLAVCNMEKFHLGLEILKEEFKNYKSAEAKRKDPIFEHLIADFENEYSDIIDNNHTITQEIQWFLNHNLYQQALTLSESHLPRQIIDKVLVNKDCITAIEDFYDNHHNDSYYKGKRTDIYTYKDGAYLIFSKWREQWFKNRQDVPYNLNITTPNNECYLDIQFSKVYDNKTLNELFQAYENVKKYRNQLNHAQAEITTAKVRNVIDDIVKTVDAL